MDNAGEKKPENIHSNSDKTSKEGINFAILKKLNAINTETQAIFRNTYNLYLKQNNISFATFYQMVSWIILVVNLIISFQNLEWGFWVTIFSAIALIVIGLLCYFLKIRNNNEKETLAMDMRSSISSLETNLEELKFAYKNEIELDIEDERETFKLINFESNFLHETLSTDCIQKQLEEILHLFFYTQELLKNKMTKFQNIIRDFENKKNSTIQDNSKIFSNFQAIQNILENLIKNRKERKPSKK